MSRHKKMNPAIKHKWVEALRSGEYKQAGGHLKTSDNRYCCLGVLCEVIDPDSLIWRQYDHAYIDKSGKRMGYPSERTERAAGITHKTAQHLASLNDRPNNFNKIAAYIEENL